MVVPGTRVGVALCLVFASTGCPSFGEEEGAQSLGAELSLNLDMPCKVSPCCFIPCTVLVWTLLAAICVWVVGLVFFFCIFSEFATVLPCVPQPLSPRLGPKIWECFSPAPTAATTLLREARCELSPRPRERLENSAGLPQQQWGCPCLPPPFPGTR